MCRTASCLVMAILSLALGSIARADDTTQPADAPAPPPSRVPDASHLWTDYPRLAPFQAVRWANDVPVVKVNGTWYQLGAIDGVPADVVVNTCRDLDAKDWKKRFEEDLVAVLSYIGSSPGQTVTLDVQTLDSGTPVTLQAVAMTADNRRAIMEAKRVADATQPAQMGAP